MKTNPKDPFNHWPEALPSPLLIKRKMGGERRAAGIGPQQPQDKQGSPLSSPKSVRGKTQGNLLSDDEGGLPFSSGDLHPQRTC